MCAHALWEGGRGGRGWGVGLSCLRSLISTIFRRSTGVSFFSTVGGGMDGGADERVGDTADGCDDTRFGGGVGVSGGGRGGE